MRLSLDLYIYTWSFVLLWRVEFDFIWPFVWPEQRRFFFFFLFGCYCCCPPFFFSFLAGQPSTHTLELCGRRVELSSTANWQWHFTTSLFVLASAVGLFPPLCTCEGRRRVVGHQSMEVLLRAACVTDYTCPCRIYIYIYVHLERVEREAQQPTTCCVCTQYGIIYSGIVLAPFLKSNDSLWRESRWHGWRRTGGIEKRNFAIAAVQVVQAAHFRPSVTLPGVLCCFRCCCCFSEAVSRNHFRSTVAAQLSRRACKRQRAVDFPCDRWRVYIQKTKSCDKAKGG